MARAKAQFQLWWLESALITAMCMVLRISSLCAEHSTLILMPGSILACQNVPLSKQSFEHNLGAFNKSMQKIVMIETIYVADAVLGHLESVRTSD